MSGGQESGVRDQGWKGGAASPQPPHQMSKRRRIRAAVCLSAPDPDSRLLTPTHGTSSDFGSIRTIHKPLWLSFTYAKPSR
jgi:hypothetical protein